MRKTIEIVIDDEGRDKGKMFRLTEMPAAQAERWALRAFLALAKSGVEFPDDISQAGFAGIAKIGLRALSGMSFADAEPLLAEMFECVAIQPDPAQPTIIRKQLVENDIEEVSTRMRLRMEVLKLHVSFSTAVAKPA